MASKPESGRDVPVSGQSGAKAPALYQGFDGQCIDGSWRPGKHGGVRVDTDPYSGATLAEMVMANNAISTRPITPQQRRKSPGRIGCRQNARR